ncbi:MAG: GDYXXLXY domain-containing protein [Deltaproteobacteria bacterium]|nr:GDYXXLXY domain-containing protein [Deltaproteobacteria bacterium]
MKSKVGAGLAIAIFFQFLVLSGIYVSAAIPLWTGSEIKVKTVPVDPRSMFRGNYARLRYEFSRIKSSHFPDAKVPRNGEIIYISLKAGDNDIYELSDVSLVAPGSGIYLRGRVENGRYRRDSYRVKYGIEAFFAPKKEALVLEKDLRHGGIAVLMVSDSGAARIKDVIGR